MKNTKTKIIFLYKWRDEVKSDKVVVVEDGYEDRIDRIDEIDRRIE